MDLATGMTLALVVNAGSTSVKVSRLARDGAQWSTVARDDNLAGALSDAAGVSYVLHRVVYGGDRLRPVVVDDAVMASLRALSELAPLHQAAALDALEQAREALPDTRHVVCFDTAFHTTIPAAARTYALPARLRELVHVVGFHGLSHAWSAGRAAESYPAARRVLVAHLGGGASLCAVLDGRSVATTMGFTPLDGLVMGTRSGSVDPGALLWLSRTTGEDLDAVLERESGLLGLCGTADLREVLARALAGDEAAVLAREVYLHRLVTSIGAMVAALGGLDVLVFTGGAGEHSAALRQLVTDRLGWLGVASSAGTEVGDGVDGERGAVSVASTPAGTGQASDASRADVRSRPDVMSNAEATSRSGVHVLVVEAREDLQMVADAADLLVGHAPTVCGSRRTG